MAIVTPFQLDQLTKKVELLRYGSETEVKSDRPIIYTLKGLSFSETIKAMFHRPQLKLVPTERKDFDDTLAFTIQLALLNEASHKIGEAYVNPGFYEGVTKNSSEIQFDEFKVSYRENKEKSENKEILIRYFSSVSYLDNYLRSLTSIVDELLMNSLYTAPLEAGQEGDSKPEALPNCELRVVHTENRIMLTCFDPWGSLKREKILARLYDVYADNKAEPLMGDAGAGLGCKFMIEHSTDFVAVCQPGKGTLFGCGLNFELGNSIGKFDVPRNFQIVML